MIAKVLPLSSCGSDIVYLEEGVECEIIATALKEISFDSVCTIEEFRQNIMYYES